MGSLLFWILVIPAGVEDHPLAHSEINCKPIDGTTTIKVYCNFYFVLQKKLILAERLNATMRQDQFIFNKGMSFMEGKIKFTFENFI